MMRRRSGIALVEALVAMVLVGFAASGFAALISASVLSESGMQAREAEVTAMDRVMTAMSLLTAEDFNRRVGTHRVGEFEVTVQLVEPGLYHVQVARNHGPTEHGLETLFFRFTKAMP